MRRKRREGKKKAGSWIREASGEEPLNFLDTGLASRIVGVSLGVVLDALIVAIQVLSLSPSLPPSLSPSQPPASHPRKNGSKKKPVSLAFPVSAEGKLVISGDSEGDKSEGRAPMGRGGGKGGECE